MSHHKEVIKIIKAEEIKNNEKQLKNMENKLSYISQNDKHLKLKISEFDKVPTPSNRNHKVNQKKSNNNIFLSSNFGLKKIKTLNINQDKAISNNPINNHFSSKVNKYDYSIDKIYTNENRENVNSLKKFKIVNNTEKKKVKSNRKEITENKNNNQIINLKKKNSELKFNNNIKNTFLGKPLFLHNFLSINSNEMRNLRKASQNLKDYSMKKDNNKNQDLHIKENNNTTNKKNKNKNFSTKNIQMKKGDDGKAIIGRKCFISNQNIIKVDISKKNLNDCVDENCDQKKGIKKKKKSFRMDFEKDLKLKRPEKKSLYQSLISMNKENIFNSDKKLIKVEQKQNKKKITKKKDDSFNSLIRNIMDSSSFSKSKSNKKKKKKILN
jgi:hypothetical protein